MLPPVPTSRHGLLAGSVQDLDVQDDVVGHDEAAAGDCHQVPADFSDDQSMAQEPTQHPYYHPSLVQAAMKANPMVMDNTIPSSIVDQFVLAADVNIASPYTQCQEPFEDKGLMQVLQCTNMTLE